MLLLCEILIVLNLEFKRTEKNTVFEMYVYCLIFVLLENQVMYIQKHIYKTDNYKSFLNTSNKEIL